MVLNHEAALLRYIGRERVMYKQAERSPGTERTGGGGRGGGGGGLGGGGLGGGGDGGLGGEGGGRGAGGLGGGLGRGGGTGGEGGGLGAKGGGGELDGGGGDGLRAGRGGGGERECRHGTQVLNVGSRKRVDLAREGEGAPGGGIGPIGPQRAPQAGHEGQLLYGLPEDAGHAHQLLAKLKPDLHVWGPAPPVPVHSALPRRVKCLPRHCGCEQDEPETDMC
eukprot:jgi/Botrbrau1/20641/Bobra.113_1s0065.1